MTSKSFMLTASMRRLVSGYLALLLIVPLLLLVNPSPSFAAPDSLAMFDLESVGATSAEITQITDKLREVLAQGGTYKLLGRDKIEVALAREPAASRSCRDENCWVRIGKNLGVQAVAFGQVTHLTDTEWKLAIRIADVSTGKVLASPSVEHVGTLASLLEHGVPQIDLAKSGASTAERSTVAPGGPKRWLIFPVIVQNGTIMNAIWILDGLDQGFKSTTGAIATHTVFPGDTPGQSLKGDPSIAKLLKSGSQPELEFAQAKAKELGADAVFYLRLSESGSTSELSLFLIDAGTGKVAMLKPPSFHTYMDAASKKVNLLTEAIVQLAARR